MAAKRESKSKKEKTGDEAIASSGRVHNAPPISEDKFFLLVRELESSERKKDTEVASVRSNRKLAKEAGINLKALDFVRKNLQGFTEPEIVEFANAIIQYSRFFRVPVIRDLTLFEVGEMTEEELLTDARQRGVIAGKRGDSIETNPWPLEVPLGREWAAGHVEGQEINLGNVGRGATH